MSDAKQNIQKNYDEFTKALEGIIEPTIKVSELREWCEANAQEFDDSTTLYVLLDDLLARFCEPEEEGK